MIVGSPRSTRSWTQLRGDLSFGDKSQVKTTRENKTLQAGPVGARENGEPSPTPAEVELRAYEIFVERGSVHGRDLDDWLQAERELEVKGR